MSTFEVFLSFSFSFHFNIHKTIHPWPSMRKTFLCISTFLYMTNFFCTRIRTLLFTSHGLYTNPIYIQRFFHFFQHALMVHTKGFFIYTRCSHTQEFLSTHHLHTKNPFIHTFLFLCICRHFIHNASFFLLGFLVHFIFRTTFLNEKLYTVPEFQQTLLTTTK